MTWIEVQFVEPGKSHRRRRCGFKDVPTNMPTTIDGRREKRVYVPVFHGEPRRFEDLFELSLKTSLSSRWPVAERAFGYSQGAFKLERRAGRQRRGNQESGRADVDLFLADSRRHVSRIASLEQIDQHFEIGACASVKLPDEVNRQLHLCRRLGSGAPRRLQELLIID